MPAYQTPNGGFRLDVLTTPRWVYNGAVVEVKNEIPAGRGDPPK